MSRAISDVRKQAWETRRKKYGEHGHSGSYARSPGPCAHCERMTGWLVRLHADGVLSEGQVSKATGLHRIEIRRRADEACPEWRDLNTSKAEGRQP